MAPVSELMIDAPRVLTDALAALRADLSPDGGADFTVEAVQELLGPVANAALAREQALPARRVVAEALAKGDSRIRNQAALVAVFVLGDDLPRATLEEALPGLGVQGAQALGLIKAQGSAEMDVVRPLFELRPYAAEDSLGTADWWVVSDLGELAQNGPLRTDHVLGVGGASITLARCTPRGTPRGTGGRVLDLGTGCGVQALHAARHAASITATDISARALAFSRFTWELNHGQDPRLDLRQGSLFEPVLGQSFDLVVSNPPFVITPRRSDVPAYEYRDGGLVGDALVESVVTGVGSVVAPGGIVQMLGNWEHHHDHDWRERVTGWLDRSGLEGWIVQREVQDAAEYAETWIRDGGTRPGRDHDGLYRAWLEDFEARGVEAVGFGLITLRRLDNDRSPQHRVEELHGPLERPLGEHLSAVLDAGAWLAEVTPSGLLEAHLSVAEDVTEERFHRPGEEDPNVVLLRQGEGFGRSVRATTALAGFVGACDGSLSAGQIISALSALLNEPADHVAAGLVPTIIGLIRDRFLVVGPGPDGV
jgi:methylase of polypeptide subunit release factors